MTDKQPLPERKNIRWDKQDYSHPGEYMVTICTKDMKQILSKITAGNSQTVGAIHESPAKQTKPTAKIILTPIGKIVDTVIKNLPLHLGVEIEKYVIMPNHIHLLIKIPYPENWQGDIPATEGRSKISKTVGYIKMNSSKQIRENFNFTNIWQRSYHDHVVRDENDLIGAINYINNNPEKWIEE